MKPQVISVGESLVEIMRDSPGQPLDQAGVFQGPFASGAPAIFAVAAARLGMRTGMVSGIGEDAFGTLLDRRLQQEGVDCSQVQRLPGTTTGIAFIAYKRGGEREFVFHLRQSAAGLVDESAVADSYFNEVKWLHISGSALALSPQSLALCRRALALTRKNQGRLSFDPNLRPELMPLAEAKECFAPFIEQADLLLPTVEEALAITGTEDEEDAARRLLAGKDRILALKRGGAGSTIYSRSGRVDQPGFSVVEVDPTGAGDCFNAACLYGVDSGWPMTKVARFANAAGALAVTRQGPMEGAPTVAQIEVLLQKSV